MSLARARFALPLVSTSLLASCAFDSGHDYAVTVTWLINGKAPSRALCEQQGVDKIRLSVRGPSKSRTIEAPCESQVLLLDEDNQEVWYGGFDTTESFNYDVLYRYDVDMIDAAGNPIPSLGYSDSFQVYFGDEEPWVLQPLELFSPSGDLSSVAGSWRIEGQAPTAESCQQLGASEVAIDVASYSDYDFVDPVEVARAPCADGAIRTVDPVLAMGAYWVRYVALDAQGKELQSLYIDSQFYDVNQGGELPLESVNFDLP